MLRNVPQFRDIRAFWILNEVLSLNAQESTASERNVAVPSSSMKS